uniref:Uncharacterized protein n=1 Tax=Avena sativa TaxID=4498 RepID=A0ACD5V6H6_AVESA
MTNSPMAMLTTFLALGLAALLLSAAGPAEAQNCGCRSNECCSQDGYCGTSSAYFGKGCQAGACSVIGGIGVPVESLVTTAFFNGVKSQAGNGCAGKSFCTRQSFLDGVRANPNFGKGRSKDDSRREIAAFFAHVTYDTRHFCYIEEINGTSEDYCDERETEWPCYAGKAYYGRGPLQLSWNYNYRPAGISVGFDGLRNPQKVAQDPVVAFKAALWFWMNNVHPVLPQGFGATTMAIRGLNECDGENSAAVNARASYYKDYCKKFGVDPGNNLTC